MYKQTVKIQLAKIIKNLAKKIAKQLCKHVYILNTKKFKKFFCNLLCLKICSKGGVKNVYSSSYKTTNYKKSS